MAFFCWKVKNIKRIFLSLFNLGVHSVLVYFIWTLPSFWLALMLHFIIMSFTFFLFEVWLKIRFNAKYYEVSPKEIKWYRALRVAWFRWLLIHTPLKWMNQRIRPDSRNISQTVYFMNEAETAHAINFFIAVAIALSTSLVHVQLSFWLLFINIFTNIYPIMVQRYNRHRIQQLLQFN